ncbi:DUF4145 domain-containing protein [Phytohabitans houttuyneae]
MTDQLALLVDSSINFRFLAEPALLLAGDAAMAEQYVESDPDAALAKTRRFSETLARMLVKEAGISPREGRDQFGRIEALTRAGLVSEHVRQLFHTIRKAGNEAVHGHSGDRRKAMAAVEACFDLGVWWFEKETGKKVSHTFVPGPPSQSASLRDLLTNIERQLAQLQNRFEIEVVSKPVSRPCPYQGLEPFEADDHARFFGRQQLRKEMKVRLDTDGLLLVVGASGAGKSSAVRAGLLPSLAADTRYARRAVLLTPGHHPVQELVNHLAHTCGLLSEAVGADLAATPPRVDRLRHATGGEAGVLPIVVDQFEELFTHCRDEQERDQFVAILAALADVAGHVAIVLAMRADFYTHCLRYPPLVRWLKDCQIVVGAMTEPELRQAIELPAQQAGVTLEPGLTELLLRDAGRDPGSLPLLSAVLFEMWRYRRDSLLTLDGYRAAGTIKGAIETAADSAYNRMGKDERRAAKEVLIRLTTLGEEVGDERTPDTRRRVAIEELTDHPHDGPVIENMLQHLARSRLVTLSDGAATIAHDVLVSGWPRLREWLAEDRPSRLLHRQLTDASKVWRQHGQRSSDLYRGQRLRQALDWATRYDASLNRLEQEFLNASASTQRRRRRLATGGAAGMMAVVLVLTMSFFNAKRGQDAAERAEAQAARASLSRKLAKAAADTFDRRPLQSMLLSVEAYRAAATDEARRELIGQAARRPGLTAFAPGLGNFGEVAAFSRDRRTLAVLDDSRVAVWDLARRHRVHYVPADPDGNGIEHDIFAVALSPDGKTLAVALDAETVLYRLPDETPAATLVDPDESQDGDDPHNLLSDIAFSPDGKLLAVAGQGGRIIVWDVASQRPHRVLDDPTSPADGPPVSVQDLAFSADGRTLAAGTSAATVLWTVKTGTPRVIPTPAAAVALSPDGAFAAVTTPIKVDRRTEWQVAVLDTASGKTAFTMARGTNPITAVAFSADGRTLVTADSSNLVSVWALSRVRQQRRLQATMPGHTTQVSHLAVTPDSSTLVSLSEDGTAIHWDLGRIALNHSSPTITALAYSPDSTILATGSYDGTITLWNTSTRTTLATLHVPNNENADHLAFSPDGRTLASAHGTNQVRLWDVHQHRLVDTLISPTPAISKLVYGPDGQRLAAAHGKGLITWNVATRKQATHRTSDELLAGELAFTPDGTSIATPTADTGKVLLWNPAGQSEPTTLEGIGTNTITFSPDSALLAAGHTAGRASLTSVKNGAMPGEIDTQNPGIVDSLAFSPDGSTLVLGISETDYKGAVAFADVGRRSVTQILPFADSVSDVIYSPDGKALAVKGNYDVQLWDLDPTSISTRLCQAAGRSLTTAEWTEFLGNEPYQPACRA